MGRSTQVLRTGAFALLLTVATNGEMATVEAMKGFRALVFSGELIREPIRVGDFDTATELYLRFMRGRTMPSDSVSILEGRRCVLVAAFLANDRNMNTPLESLPAGGGDFNYRLYLFAKGERPVMTAGSHLWRVTAEVAKEVQALGVPVADTTRSATDCALK
jgi:hypothetical protein